MSLRKSLCIAFALTSLSGFAAAQDQPAQEAPARQPGGNRGQRFTDDLATRLELDAQQKEQFDKIVAELRAQQAEAAPADAQGQGRRGGGGQQMMEKLFEQVQPILRPDQVEKLNQARQDMGRQGQGRMNPMQRLDQLKGELGLSPEQTAAFDEAAAKLREQMQARQNSDEQRQMQEQMREAQQSGDQAKIDEMRNKMREGFTAMQQSMDAFYEDLNKTLTPEQQKKLSDFRAQNQMGGNRVRLDPKQIIEIAQKLDLTAEQRAGLGEIEQQYAEQIHNAQPQDQAQRQGQGQGQGGGNRGGNQASQRLINDINQMLTDDQKKHFDQLLQRVSQQRNGQPGQGQGQQRGQGRRAQPAGEAEGQAQETP